MEKDEFESICKKAIEHYGEENQICKAVEEMGELSQALMKVTEQGMQIEKGIDIPSEECFIAVQSVLEEMADVEIMITQLKMMYGSSEGYVDYKLNRLSDRIAKEEKSLQRRKKEL